MNIRISDYISILKNWKHVSGYSRRAIIKEELYLKLNFPDVVEYSIKTESKYNLDGKSILFFSDLHYKDKKNIYFPDIIEREKPDWILFGGDFITYACFIDGAFEWLKKNFDDFPNIPKLAVLGNWDRRRGNWFPLRLWYEKYNKAGFKLLINESVSYENVKFFGLDDPKIGNPLLNICDLKQDCFNCILSHSVEPVVDVFNNTIISGDNLALCGHSHGGQIRLPFFGAVFTSTKFWKLFEYGLYKHKNSNIELIMTSGLGTTRLPIRVFCKPEVVLIKFEDKLAP